MKRYGKEPDKKPKHDIKKIQSQIHTRESMEETKQDYSTNNQQTEEMITSKKVVFGIHAEIENVIARKMRLKIIIEKHAKEYNFQKCMELKKPYDVIVYFSM